MYFIRKLKEFNIDVTLCTLFYKSVIESIISFCITSWGGNAYKTDVKRIDKIINKAGRYTHGITDVQGIFDKFCMLHLNKILNDDNHPIFNRITRSYRHNNRLLSQTTKTTRHLNSFLPYSIRLFQDNK